jgi:hypothetical protein
MDLEAQLKAAGESSVGGVMSRPGGAGGGDSRMIPRGPARARLSGHRGPITSVCTHPIYRFLSLTIVFHVPNW